MPHWAVLPFSHGVPQKRPPDSHRRGPTAFPGCLPAATLGSTWAPPSLPLWRGCDVLGSSPKSVAASGTLTSRLLQGTGLEIGDGVSGLLGRALFRMTHSSTCTNHRKCEHFGIQAQRLRLPLTLRSGTEILRQDTLFLSSGHVDAVRRLRLAGACLRPILRRRVLRPEQVRIAVLPPQTLGSPKPWTEAHSTALLLGYQQPRSKVRPSRGHTPAQHDSLARGPSGRQAASHTGAQGPLVLKLQPRWPAVSSAWDSRGREGKGQS